MAREKRVAVVFRRGPSKKVCTILWDRTDDTFTLGQWLRGRIYERRADISPDGKHLIYFAMNGYWKSKVSGAWTAISRTPYLKAITLLAKGDCWQGGGLFTSNDRYWLNDGYGHEILHESSTITRDQDFEPVIRFGGECTGVYYPRLMRDGWALTRQERFSDGDAITIFEKPLPRGWTLRKIAHESVNHEPGHGCYWDEHVLLDAESGREFPQPQWEWADLDGRSLTWAERGCIYRATVGGDSGYKEPKLLGDLNDWSYSRIKAPY